MFRLAYGANHFPFISSKASLYTSEVGCNVFRL